MRRPMFLLPVVALLICDSLIGQGNPVQESNGSKERMSLLAKNKRVLFLGDSITFSGGYIYMFETWLESQDISSRPMIIDAGLPSETVSGLSEEGHAGGRFPRPDLDERLDRVLELTQPDLVFACYGINCGIYQPFDEERFKAYQNGIKNLRNKVRQAGAEIVLLTPPTYDDQRAKKKFSYNAVLDKYSEWLVSQKENGWIVIDLHSAMNKSLAKRRKKSPEFTFQPDAVHPNQEGHWFVASQLIHWFGGKEAAAANSHQEMLKTLGKPKDFGKMVQGRMAVLRDAYVFAAGHKRPGVKPGLPLKEAIEKANALTRKIRSNTK